MQWLRGAGPWRPYGRGEASEDPLLASGGDSAGLERYRLAKAALAELELAERKRVLLPVDKVREALLRWATLVRRMGERLGKRFGHEAAAVVGETLDECEATLRDDFRPRDP